MVTTREEHKKHKIRKRHLTMGVMEAYTLWKEEHPDKKVGKSTFANLRTLHVLLISELPNVGVCVHHKNLTLLLDRLHKFNDQFPQYNTKRPFLWACKKILMTAGSTVVRHVRMEKSSNPYILLLHSLLFLKQYLMMKILKNLSLIGTNGRKS